MRGVNKVILVGTLGRDPEVRYTPNGNAIANLSVATTEQWTDKQTNQKQEKTEWHRVVIFGKLAEIAGQYLRKGSQVYLEGKLQTRKWQDQSGQDRYSTEIVLDVNGQMQMLGGSRDNNTTTMPNTTPHDSNNSGGYPEESFGGSYGSPARTATNTGYASNPTPARAPVTPSYPNSMDGDDIPF